jgi:hypothetical protein
LLSLLKAPVATEFGLERALKADVVSAIGDGNGNLEEDYVRDAAGRGLTTVTQGHLSSRRVV